MSGGWEITLGVGLQNCITTHEVGESVCHSSLRAWQFELMLEGYAEVMQITLCCMRLFVLWLWKMRVKS